MPGFSKLKKKNLVDNKKTLPLHSVQKNGYQKKSKDL